MIHPVAARIQALTGRRVTATQPLSCRSVGSGGSVGQVLLAELENGGRLVAKLGPGMEPEGWMLRYLASHTRLPVPHLVHDDDDLLLMDHVASGDPLSPAAQAHAAELLAGLHAHSWHSFGMERDTVIGGLTQSNPPTATWRDFFRDHRLLDMAAQAHQAGRLPDATRARIDDLAGRLDRWIEEPAQPALLHGDAWTGNLLVRGGRIAAFVDPALSYGHPEMELAFGTLFGTFGDAFFRRYGELAPIAPGFWEERRELYLLYPLLVHVRLFGGSYLQGVEGILDRFGV